LTIGRILLTAFVSPSAKKLIEALEDVADARGT
jgi:hypothetical protein